MTATLNDMMAREHVRDLLRHAEEQRRGVSPRTEGATGSHFTLDDRRSVRVRGLLAADRSMYEAAVSGLSKRSRYLRFAAPIHTISRSLLDRMMNVDDERHVVYAALTPDETAIVGVARFVAGQTPSVAEVAIAVADDWQGQGLGLELLRRVVEHARASGLECLTATTLSENDVAARLALAIGFSVSGRAGIYTEYEMSLGGALRATG
jgi:acetyltransferase